MSASVSAPVCQCEHVDHETGDAHGPRDAWAGKRRAMHVGPVCDECANGHLLAYLVCSQCRGDLAEATGVCVECGHDELGYLEDSCLRR